MKNFSIQERENVLIKRIIDLASHLLITLETDDDRVLFIEKITETICRNCGTKHCNTVSCSCTNHE